MLHLNKPFGFDSSLEVSVSIIEARGDVLLLVPKTKQEKPVYCLPREILKAGEDPFVAATRCLNGTLGLKVSPQHFRHVNTYYVKSDIDCTYHALQTPLLSKPLVTLSLAGHSSYRWANIEQAMHLPLLSDDEACLRALYTQFR